MKKFFRFSPLILFVLSFIPIILFIIFNIDIPGKYSTYIWIMLIAAPSIISSILIFQKIKPKKHVLIILLSLAVFVSTFIIFLSTPSSSYGNLTTEGDALLMLFSFGILIIVAGKYFLNFVFKIIIQLFRFLLKVIVKVYKDPKIIFPVLGFAAILIYIIYLNVRIVNIEKRFGGTKILKCSGTKIQETMNKSLVRIEGLYAEGTGFPISENQIFTNFHVIDGEPSPKVVFSDGTVITPTKIIGNREKDMAILTVDTKLKPLPFFGYMGTSENPVHPVFGEPLYAAGFALGSELKGGVTINQGSYNGTRFEDSNGVNYIQTDTSLVSGMSGGPLLNACGQVVGVNTQSVAGLSMYIDMTSVQNSIGELSDKDIAKIKIDTSTPIGVVQAFYSYIGSMQLKNAYDLIDPSHLGGQSFEYWTEGYATTIQVYLVSAKADTTNKNKINIKLESEDWQNGTVVFKYFEGYWIVGDNLKLKGVSIHEISEPDYKWFYE